MKLQIGNSIIPLDAGISLPLVLRSPLFDTSEGKTPGSYIFDTTLPATPELRGEFGQAHRPQRAGRATATLPYKLSSGILRYEGTCKLTEADPDSYSASFAVENGELAYQLKDKTLKDLDWGPDIAISDIYSIASKEIEWTIDEDYPVNFLTNVVVDNFNVLLDIKDSFSTFGGGIYIAQDTGIVTLNIRFIYHMGWGDSSFRIEKNGIIINTYPCTNTGDGWHDIINTIELDLVVGDVIAIWYNGVPEYWHKDDGDHWVLQFRLREGSFIEYKTTNVFNDNLNNDQVQCDFTAFPVENPEFFANFPDDHFMLDNRSIKELYSKYFPVLNYFKDGEFPMFMRGMIENDYIFAANLFTPFLYIFVILKKIAAESGYDLNNCPYANDGLFKNMVLFNAYAENLYSTADTSVTLFKKTFNLVDHVPAMAQIEFLREAAKVAGMRLVVSNNDRTITFVSLLEQLNMDPKPFPGIILDKPLVKISPEYAGIKFEFKKASRDQYIADRLKDIDTTVTYKGSVGWSSELLLITGQKLDDCYLIEFTNELYIWRYNPETYIIDWIFYSESFFLAYQEGVEPFLTISNEFCPVLSSKILDETVGAPVGRQWLIPRTSQPGIMEGIPSTDAEFSKQIICYRGMHLDSLGNTYPLGTSGNKNYNNDVFDPGVALCAAGDPANMYDSAHKAWMQWLAYDAKPVKYKALLTRGQLASIKQHEPYSEPHGVVFLIEEIRVNLLADGLSVAEMDVYTK